MTIIKYLLTIILIFSFITGCKESTVVDSSIDPVQIDDGDDDTNDDDGLGLIPPYVFSGIIAHGASSSTVQWSSSTVPNLSGSQSIFVTDSLLRIRVQAKASPGKVDADSYGNPCNYYQLPYTKLRIPIGVRTSNSSSYIDSFAFEDVSIGNFSDVHTFTVPTNSISAPFAVEVYGVQWDYSCIFSGGQSDTYCPWDNVWQNDCFEIEVQMQTDYTNDL